MDFLEVLKGLKEGKVYAHPSFSRDEYLVLDEFGNLNMYTHGEVMLMPMNIDELLSEDWFEKPKKKMYIVSVDIRSHIVTDEGYTEYVLSEEDKEWADSWEDKVFSEDEIKSIRTCVELKKSSRSDWREDQEEKLNELFPNEKGHQEE